MFASRILADGAKWIVASVAIFQLLATCGCGRQERELIITVTTPGTAPGTPAVLDSVEVYYTENKIRTHVGYTNHEGKISVPSQYLSEFQNSTRSFSFNKQIVLEKHEYDEETCTEMILQKVATYGFSTYDCEIRESDFKKTDKIEKPVSLQEPDPDKNDDWETIDNISHIREIQIKTEPEARVIIATDTLSVPITGVLTHEICTMPSENTPNRIQLKIEKTGFFPHSQYLNLDDLAASDLFEIEQPLTAEEIQHVESSSKYVNVRIKNNAPPSSCGSDFTEHPIMRIETDSSESRDITVARSDVMNIYYDLRLKAGETYHIAIICRSSDSDIHRNPANESGTPCWFRLQVPRNFESLVASITRDLFCNDDLRIVQNNGGGIDEFSPTTKYPLD